MVEKNIEINYREVLEELFMLRFDVRVEISETDNEILVKFLFFDDESLLCDNLIYREAWNGHVDKAMVWKGIVSRIMLSGINNDLKKWKQVKINS